jgi:hypothetical protein
VSKMILTLEERIHFDPVLVLNQKEPNSPEKKVLSSERNLMKECYAQ